MSGDEVPAPQSLNGGGGGDLVENQEDPATLKRPRWEHMTTFQPFFKPYSGLWAASAMRVSAMKAILQRKPRSPL